MGNAFDENVYQECMEIALKERGVEFEPQKKLPLKYKGKTLRHFYQPDLFCFGKIIVELKASAAIADVHRAASQLSSDHWMQAGAFDQLRDASEGFNREICPLVQAPSSVFFARRANFGVASEPGKPKVDGGEVAAGEAAGFEPDGTSLPSIARQRDSGLGCVSGFPCRKS